MKDRRERAAAQRMELRRFIQSQIEVRARVCVWVRVCVLAWARVCVWVRVYVLQNVAIISQP